MQMNKETLIISMTSWPKRIANVGLTLFSILRQIKEHDVHLVLVLAEEEFPNKLLDLPADLNTVIKTGAVEVIWCTKNIYSHKKLMPTILSYPDNPILICDDDIVRPDGWVDMFVRDHIKNPHDILVGGCVFDIAFDGDTFNPVKQFRFDSPDSAGKPIRYRRPANGFGGVLYPPGTFTDERFFNWDNMLRLSRYSDESWQYCFNIIENRILRWTSKIYSYQYGQQPGTYETSMSKSRGNDKHDSYNEIYERLFNEFPEFKIKLKQRLS